MKKQWNQTSERILDLTLEIIYLLTGQHYAPIKKPCDAAARSRDPCLLNGSCRTPNHSTNPPLHSLTHEEISEKKILELTNKIIQLLTGEVPVRCEDVAIYFSMEEWEYLEKCKNLCKEETVETYQPVGLLGGVEKAFPISISDCKSTSENDIKKTRMDHLLVNEPQKRPFECIGIKRDHSERGPTHINVKSTSCSIDVYTPATECKSAHNKAPVSLVGAEKATHESFPISGSSDCRSTSQCEIRNQRVDYPLVNKPQKRPYSIECIGNKRDHSEHWITRVNKESTSCSIDVYIPATERIPALNRPPGSSGGVEKATGKRVPISVSSECRHSDLKNPRLDYPIVNEPQKRPFECIGNKEDHSERGPTHVNEKSMIDVYIPSPECTSTLNKPEPVLSERENLLICSPREHSQADDMCIRIVEVKSQGTSADANVHTHTEHAPAEFPSHRDSENRFSCFECGENFTETKCLVEHRKIHSEDKPYSCFECVERFTDKPSLFRHQLGHTKEKGYTCPECNRTFLYESRFSRHQKVHLTKTPLKATDCVNCFTHLMRLAKDKPFSCSECEERFTESSALIRHQFIHVQQKEYPCPECGKIFPYETALMTHLRVHAKKKKTHICSECGTSFTKKANLLQHQWVHTGVKPFECSCGKRFAYQASLSIHQRVHKGENQSEFSTKY